LLVVRGSFGLQSQRNQRALGLPPRPHVLGQELRVARHEVVVELGALLQQGVLELTQVVALAAQRPELTVVARGRGEPVGDQDEQQRLRGHAEDQPGEDRLPHRPRAERPPAHDRLSRRPRTAGLASRWFTSSTAAGARRSNRCRRLRRSVPTRVLLLGRGRPPGATTYISALPRARATARVASVVARADTEASS